MWTHLLSEIGSSQLQAIIQERIKLDLCCLLGEHRLAKDINMPWRMILCVLDVEGDT